MYNIFQTLLLLPLLMMSMLPNELLVNIFEYSDDLRILKIQMDKKNIKYLFENIADLEYYLYEKTSSFTPCLGECIYLTTINLLSNKKMSIDNVFVELCKSYSTVDKKYVETTILNIIIDDYNNYYLDDKYYYGGYWYDENWVKSENV